MQMKDIQRTAIVRVLTIKMLFKFQNSKNHFHLPFVQLAQISLKFPPNHLPVSYEFFRRKRRLIA